MPTIKISKLLQKYVNNNTEVTIQADNYFNLYTNLVNLFPELRRYVKTLPTNRSIDLWFVVGKKVLTYQELFLPVSKNKRVAIVPMVKGSGGNSGIFTALAGIALIVASVVIMNPELGVGAALGLTTAGEGAVTGGAAGAAIAAGVGSTLTSVGTFITGELFSVGLSLVVSGVLSLLNSAAPPNTGQNAAGGSHNDTFGSLQNTTAVNTPIPLIFGLHRVGGQFISGQVSTFTFDGIDPIYVYNYVY